jgi:hypothetical protein
VDLITTSQLRWDVVKKCNSVDESTRKKKKSDQNDIPQGHTTKRVEWRNINKIG